MYVQFAQLYIRSGYLEVFENFTTFCISGISRRRRDIYKKKQQKKIKKGKPLRGAKSENDAKNAARDRARPFEIRDEITLFSALRGDAHSAVFRVCKKKRYRTCGPVNADRSDVIFVFARFGITKSESQTSTTYLFAITCETHAAFLFSVLINKREATNISFLHLVSRKFQANFCMRHAKTRGDTNDFHDFTLAH